MISVLIVLNFLFISEIRRKQPSPEPGVKRDVLKSEPSANGRWNGSSHPSLHGSFSPPSPVDYDEMDVDNHSEQLDRGLDSLYFIYSFLLTSMLRFPDYIKYL